LIQPKERFCYLREDIKKDQKLLSVFYKERENLDKRKWELKQLTIEKEQLNKKLNEIKTELEMFHLNIQVQMNMY